MARRPGSDAARKSFAEIPGALENVAVLAAEGPPALGLAAVGGCLNCGGDSDDPDCLRHLHPQVL